jgi:hypothetical protein
MKTKLFLFLSLVIIPCACVSQKPFDWARTTDQFNPKTRVYYNKSIPMKLTLPNDWEVYAEPETSRDFYQLASEIETEGLEMAMWAQHPSEVLAVTILLEKWKKAEEVFSLTEYIALLKEINKDDLKDCKELLLVKKDLRGLQVADWKYEVPIEELGKAIVRECVFFHNDYAVRVRCFSPSLLYQKFEPKFNEILQSISVE